MNPSKILIRKGDVENAKKEVERYAGRGCETGYSILGKIHANRVYEIARIVKAGPNSRRGSVHFSIDPEVVREALEQEMKKDKDARYLGDCHSHPWSPPPQPSHIDINQLKRAKETRPWFVIGVHSLDA